MDAIQGSAGYGSYGGMAVPRPGTYEANVKELGPVVANLIGAGQALAQTASSTVSFSASALDQATQAVKDDYQALADGVGSAFTTAGRWAQQGLSAVEDAGAAVVHGVEQGAGAVADGASSLASGVSELGQDLAVYAGAGLSALGIGLDARA